VRRRLPVTCAATLVAAAAQAAPPSTPLSSAAPPPPLLSAPPPPPSVAPSSSAAAPSPALENTCVEHVPLGKDRPKLTEKFPTRGQSGHVLTLSLTLEHGKGETVLPGGFQLQTEDPTFRGLERVGLYLPDPDGGAGPVLKRTEQGDRATTHVEISFVPLPQKPGRNVLVVPALPVTVARASGDVIVLCTEPHEVTIEDPIANSSNPTPRPNPAPRPEREEWTALKNALMVGAGALVLGALAAWLIGKWLRRPRPVPPPPPPRPPWEVALEELFDIRHAGLIGEGRLAEHFDRVSDSLRKYLGARFGFDGLESTTREALSVLRDVAPGVGPLDAIETFLRQADLVKFAKTVPTADDGELALVRAEHIVRETLPTIGVTAAGVPTTTLPSALPAPAEAPPVAAAGDDEFAKWGPKPSVAEPKPNAPPTAEPKPNAPPAAEPKPNAPSAAEPNPNAPPGAEPKPSTPKPPGPEGES
jgi:hypothetical protein